MKILSWNINGIRAIERKGKLDDILSKKFDIYNFQETKIDKENLEKMNLNFKDYNKSWSFSTIKKGYSGVSTWSKEKPLNIKLMQNKKFDQEGRFLLTEYKNFYLINGYFPNGQDSHARVPYKLEFSYEVLKLAKKLENKKGVIICGDINTAHNEIDLARPNQNRKSTGFLLNERKFIDDLINNNFIDCFRFLNPKKENQYSWWSYRGKAKENNVGWRIDYFFISNNLIPFLNDCYYMDNYEGSDHCPLILELKFK